MKVTTKTLAVMLLLSCALGAQQNSGEAAEAPAPELKGAYELEYVFHELEGGKAVNRRAYVMQIASSRGNGSIRVGTRIPIVTQNEKGPTVTYLDAGFNIDARLVPLGDQLRVHTNLEVSSLVQPEEFKQNTSGNPVLRSLRFSSASLLEAGKPVIIATIDDLNTPRQFRIELTAKRVK